MSPCFFFRFLCCFLSPNFVFCEMFFQFWIVLHISFVFNSCISSFFTSFGFWKMLWVSSLLFCFFLFLLFVILDFFLSLFCIFHFDHFLAQFFLSKNIFVIFIFSDICSSIFAFIWFFISFSIWSFFFSLSPLSFVCLKLFFLFSISLLSFFSTVLDSFLWTFPFLFFSVFFCPFFPYLLFFVSSFHFDFLFSPFVILPFFLHLLIVHLLFSWSHFSWRPSSLTFSFFPISS